MKSRLLLVAAVATLAAGCTIPGQKIAHPPAVPTGAHAGGDLRVAVTAPSGVTPISGTNNTGELISGLLCDTLISTNPVTGAPEPGLASSWQTSGTTVTIKLRHNLTLTDGKPLTAPEVVHSLSALVNPTTASPAGSLLSEVVGYSSLAGNNFANSDATLAGLSTVDTYDLQIALTAKDPGFINALTRPETAPYVGDSTGDPDCVGPYKLSNPWDSGAKTITLVRSTNYYAANVGYTGGGSGYPNQIDVGVYATGRLATAAFDHGRADLVEAGSNPSANATTLSAALPAEEYLGFPFDATGITGSTVVRQALSEALNRTAIVVKAFGTHAVADAGLLPNSPGFASLNVGCGGVSAAGDVSAAKALLTPAESTALASASITIDVNNDPANLAEITSIANQWHGDFGLTVHLKSSSYSSYLSNATTGVGFTEPFRISWSAAALSPIATYLDPVDYLDGLFVTTATKLGNWAHFQSKAIDAELSLSATPATLGVQRNQETRSIEKQLCEQLPLIPLATAVTTWDASGDVRCARSTCFLPDGTPDLREVYLS